MINDKINIMIMITHFHFS